MSNNAQIREMSVMNPAEANTLVDRAIIYATEHHAGQLRKGTTLPYIVHPLEVQCILAGMKADAALLAAGVLHDTLEDTSATPEEIRQLFGEDVLALVSSNSENKSKSWQERKAHTIEELRRAPVRQQMLIMADKVANLRSMRSDHRRVGEELWKRFNAPVEKQSWYFEGIRDALVGLQQIPDAAPVYAELVRLYEGLFVTYHRCGDALYRFSRSGEGRVIRRGEAQWLPSNGEIPQGAEPVCREKAEGILRLWQDEPL